MDPDVNPALHILNHTIFMVELDDDDDVLLMVRVHASEGGWKANPRNFAKRHIYGGRLVWIIIN